jgi:SAM-dependent methyltransferase
MELEELALPALHNAFYNFINPRLKDRKSRILDLGAGTGAFTERLHKQGHDVHACDLYAERYRYPKVKCDKVDLNMPWSLYADGNFDALTALEVIEHLMNVGLFLSESSRILKPGGKLFLSTPNILFLKSRLTFLIKGHHHGFGISNTDSGMEHILPLTPEQIAYIAGKCGLNFTNKGSHGKSSVSKFMKPVKHLLPKNPNNDDMFLDSLSLFMEFTKR